MAEIIYSLLLLGIGILGLFFSVKSLINPAFAKKYIDTSPKAWLLRKLFGVEKAPIITRKIFIPLGIIFSLGLIILGIILFVI